MWPCTASPGLLLQLLLQGLQPLLPITELSGIAKVIIQLLLSGSQASLHNTQSFVH
jgi:hypothetical protein